MCFASQATFLSLAVVRLVNREYILYGFYDNCHLIVFKQRKIEIESLIKQLVAAIRLFVVQFFLVRTNTLAFKKKIT